MKRAWLIALTLLLLISIRMAFLSLTSTPPSTQGRQLAPCPDTPNCVSSQVSKESQLIEPLAVPGSADVALETVVRALESLPRARIVAVDGGYLRVEFTSLLFRFVDDLELLYDSEKQQFDVRSASRVGQSDLGANRRRVEALRSRLEARGSV